MDGLALKSQQAKPLMAEGKFQQAIAVYAELNEVVPKRLGLEVEPGHGVALGGQAREANPELEQAVKLDP